MRLSGEDKRIFCSELFTRDPCLFVKGFHAAPVAELLHFDLALHQLLIFIGVIIAPLANTAAERDQSVGMFNLGHGENNTRLGAILQ